MYCKFRVIVYTPVKYFFSDFCEIYSVSSVQPACFSVVGRVVFHQFALGFEWMHLCVAGVWVGLSVT